MMGKGSGSATPQPTSSTVTQTNLPEYAKPYFTELLERTAGETQQPYEAFPGARLQQLGPRQQAANQMVQDIATSGTPLTLQLAAQIAAGATGYTPNYAPTSFQGGTFGADQAQHYMSPYLDQVLNRQQARTQQRFGEAQAGRDTRAVAAGAFGGSRAGVVDEVARREMNMQLSDNEARAMDAAYNQAGSLYQRDRDARLQAQGMSDASRRQAATFGIQGQQIGLAGGQQLMGIAGLSDQLGMARADALSRVGGQEQALAQQGLDIGYQDFTNQRDFDRQNLQLYSSILRGVPAPAGSEVTQYTAPPNQLNSMLGLGITGLGLYNELNRT